MTKCVHQVHASCYRIRKENLKAILNTDGTDQNSAR